MRKSRSRLAPGQVPLARALSKLGVLTRSQAIAAITPLIAAARQRNDASAAAELVDLRKRCIAERNQLQATDHTAVAEVTRRYRAMAEQLQQQAS